MDVSAQRGLARGIAAYLAAFALIALALLIPSMAQAAVPANDDIGAATVITSLPYTDTLDTTEATTAADDPDSCGGSRGTVWYTFTPSADIRLDANTIGSSYDTKITVYSGSPGALTLIDCNGGYGDGAPGASRVRFNATGGQTLYIQAASCCEQQPGSSLTLALAEAPPRQCFDGIDNDLDGLTDGSDPGCTGHPADDDETDPPPPLQVGVSLNRVGVVSASGQARISGTVTCNQYTLFSIGGTVSQTRHDVTVYSPGYIRHLICTPPSASWTMSTGFGGPHQPFSPGPAQANVYAAGFNGVEYITVNTSGEVRLRRQRTQ